MTLYFRYLDKIAQMSSPGTEKDVKVQMNLCLNEYYINKGRYP